MKSNKAKLREASKKAQRTRKLMQRSRQEKPTGRLVFDGAISEKQYVDMKARQETTGKAEPAPAKPGREGHSTWPPYMKRALPLPDVC